MNGALMKQGGMTRMESERIYKLVGGVLILALLSVEGACTAKRQISLSNVQLSVSVRSEDGAYEMSTRSLSKPVLISRVAVEVNRRWISSTAYPSHHEAEAAFQDILGAGHKSHAEPSGDP